MWRADARTLHARAGTNEGTRVHPAMSPEQPNNLRAPLPTDFTTAHRRLIKIAGYFVVLVRDVPLSPMGPGGPGGTRPRAAGDLTGRAAP